MRKKKVLARIMTSTLSIPLSLFGGLARAQVTTKGRISGTVMDQQGAVILSAVVAVKNNQTGAENTVKSCKDLTFFIAALPVGTYTGSVAAQRFKQTTVTDARIKVGTSVTEVKLEVGLASKSVTVTGFAEVLPTHRSDIGPIISSRQITELPFNSRDALVTTLSATTPDRSRSSSVDRMAKASPFISLDGINAQDNLLRMFAGFFRYIGPHSPHSPRPWVSSQALLQGHRTSWFLTLRL
jgi:carboxypeptidase family protein